MCKRPILRKTLDYAVIFFLCIYACVSAQHTCMYFAWYHSIVKCGIVSIFPPTMNAMKWMYNVYAIVYTIVKRRNIYENKRCSWPSDAVGEQPYSCRQTDWSNFPDLHDRTRADLYREESATEIKIIQNRMLLLPEIGMIALWMYRLTWLLTLCSTKCTPFNEVLQNLCLYCEKPSLAAQVPL